jgi:hypothetical protein
MGKDELNKELVVGEVNKKRKIKIVFGSIISLVIVIGIVIFFYIS